MSSESEILAIRSLISAGSGSRRSAALRHFATKGRQALRRLLHQSDLQHLLFAHQHSLVRLKAEGLNRLLAPRLKSKDLPPVGAPFLDKPLGLAPAGQRGLIGGRVAGRVACCDTRPAAGRAWRPASRRPATARHCPRGLARIANGPKRRRAIGPVLVATSRSLLIVVGQLAFERGLHEVLGRRLAGSRACEDSSAQPRPIRLRRITASAEPRRTMKRECCAATICSFATEVTNHTISVVKPDDVLALSPERIRTAIGTPLIADAFYPNGAGLTRGVRRYPR